jgi:hypothetical protein
LQSLVIVYLEKSSLMIRASRTEFIYCLLFTATVCLSAATPRTDVLSNQADAIIVAEVQNGQQAGRQVSMALAIERVIKGTLPVGTSVNVRWDASWPPVKAVLPAYYGVWFLTATSSGHWVLLPVRDGRIPVQLAYFPLSKSNAPSNASGTLSATSVIDRMALELSTAIEHYTDVDELIRVSSGLVQISDTPVTIDIYRRLSTSADPEIRALGLGALITKTNDAVAIAELVKDLDRIANLRMGSFALNAIRYLRDPSPNTIDALSKVASSKNPAAQRSAAEALRDLHTREALSALGSLLDSPDRETREAAIKGFSMFVENLPITTPDSIPSQRWRVPQGPAPFRTSDTDRYSLSTRALDQAQEAAYLQFWKSWWARFKVQIAP